MKTLGKGARGRALFRDRSGDQSHLMRAPLATDLHTEDVTVQAGVLFQLELPDQRAQRFRWIARKSSSKISYPSISLALMQILSG